MPDPFRASTSGTKSSVGSHTIYSISTMIPCTIFISHNHETNLFPLMETFRHLYTQHNFQIQESGSTLGTPREEPKISLMQASMMEIPPPPNVDDTQHHIWFISSCIGTMTHVVCSFIIGVETATTTKVVVPSTVQAQSVCTLSTSSGSTTLTMESYSCMSTNFVTTEPLPHGLTQTHSPLDTLFHLDEDILEAMTKPDYLWDAMHHHSFFLPENKFGPKKPENHEIYAI